MMMMTSFISMSQRKAQSPGNNAYFYVPDSLRLCPFALNGAVRTLLAGSSMGQNQPLSDHQHLGPLRHQPFVFRLQQGLSNWAPVAAFHDLVGLTVLVHSHEVHSVTDADATRMPEHDPVDGALQRVLVEMRIGNLCALTDALTTRERLLARSELVLVAHALPVEQVELAGIAGPHDCIHLASRNHMAIDRVPDQ